MCIRDRVATVEYKEDISNPLLTASSGEGLYTNGLPIFNLGKTLLGLEVNSVKDGRSLLKGCIGPVTCS